VRLLPVRLTFSAVTFTFAFKIEVLVSVMTVSISAPDNPIRTGSPTCATGPASRTGRCFGVFS
jgi:hypothetical protein